MDIYEYAMKMEKDGEAYYRELAQKAAHEGVKSILTMLADAEVKHYRIFQKMKNNEKADSTDTEFLEGVKNIFEKMREGHDISTVDISDLSMYRVAQEIEKKSENLYLEKADELDDPSKKDMFRKIAKEEARHFKILENIITMLQRPEQWLENPEWYHLEEY